MLAIWRINLESFIREVKKKNHILVKVMKELERKRRKINI